VGERSARLWSTALRLTVCGGLMAFCSTRAAAQAPQTAPPRKSITSSIKEGFDKLTGAGAPKKPPSEAESFNDAISLKSNARPRVEVYVAVARLYEQSGKLAEAEQNYQLALKEKPQDLAALLGYAHLKEQLGKPDEAIKLYQQAAAAHRNDAAVFNNLGLCYARRDRLEEAAVAMERAVSLQPKNKLYRNNIAAVLVDAGRTHDAFMHLRAAHGDAAAHYNLGYLLNTKGQRQEAVQHFAVALQLDPSLSQARMWLDRLQGPPPRPTAAVQTRVPAGQPGTPVLVSSRPMPPAGPNGPGGNIVPSGRGGSVVPNGPGGNAVQNGPSGNIGPSGPSGNVHSVRRPDAKYPPPRSRAAEGFDPSGRSAPSSDAPPMPPELSMPMRLPPTELSEPAVPEMAPLPR